MIENSHSMVVAEEGDTGSQIQRADLSRQVGAGGSAVDPGSRGKQRPGSVALMRSWR